MIANYLSRLSLEKEIDDFDLIHENILKDVSFRGTNLWILVFAIFVASIGLNMNSTAVVIGAMLISPLMGPINGMGYSIATYNFPLLRRSLRNFTFAVFTSLVASTIYFAISPVSTAHSELLARTSPTIYDVLIALFGGLAGIVAISSKQKGNVIPGVAIATALMPPLCTAGFGLATANFYYFFGALYLFTINTVFIALSSILISQLLKFPNRTFVNGDQKKKVKRWISIVILFTLIPSIYFGYVLVQKERFNKQAENFIKKINVFEGNYLLRSEIDANKKKITLVYAGSTITPKTIKDIKDRAIDFNIDSSKIKIQKGLALDEINNLSIKNQSKMAQLQNKITQLNLLLKDNQRKKDSIVNRINIGKQLLSEIQPLYPEIKTCSFSETKVFEDSKVQELTIVTFSHTNQKLKERDKAKIRKWLRSRIANKKNKVYFDFEPVPSTK